MTADGSDATVDLLPELMEAPGADPAQVLSAYAARSLEREGIPMFVALHDAREGRTPLPPNAAPSGEGSRLAELFTFYDRRLLESPPAPAVVPVEADGAAVGPADPTGAADLINTLVVLSELHLRPRQEVLL